MKISHAILSLIFRLIPKSSRILVYSSFPDYSDNSYAMYDYLNRNRKGKYKHVWIYSDKDSAAKHTAVKGFYKYTLKALSNLFQKECAAISPFTIKVMAILSHILC